MSLGSAAAASIGGTWDVFDRIQAIIDAQIKRLRELDAEDADSLLDFGMVDGEIDAVGSRDEMIAALEQAKMQIDAACLTCQRTEAALPD